MSDETRHCQACNGDEPACIDGKWVDVCPGLPPCENCATLEEDLNQQRRLIANLNGTIDDLREELAQAHNAAGA